MIGPTPVVTLEEHYAWEPLSKGNAVAEMFKKEGLPAYKQLYDREELRLDDMDAAGIDYQILSLLDPGVQELDSTTEAVERARQANDDLAKTVRAYPKRFGAFAALPTQSAHKAADELKRAIHELGFHGGLINGHSRGRYLDDPAYKILFSTAERLKVPLYLHPTSPHQAVFDAWFAPYKEDGLHLASWGFAVETGTHALRLVYSGVFDRFPHLKLILGHMGEMLPFALQRLDRYYLPGAWYLSPDERAKRLNGRKMPSEYLLSNCYITTSGNFFQPALACALATFGPERILFSVDYPMDNNQIGMDFLRDAPISDEQRTAIAGGNAARLFQLSL